MEGRWQDCIQCAIIACVWAVENDKNVGQLVSQLKFDQATSLNAWCHG